MTLEKQQEQFAKLFDELKATVKKAEIAFLNASLNGNESDYAKLANEIDCLAGYQEELMPKIDRLLEAQEDEKENPRCPTCGAPAYVSVDGGQGEEKGCSH